MLSNDLRQYLLGYTLDYMPKATAQYMPDGPYRDFYVWAISGRNSHRDEFLECLSVFQIVELLYRTVDGFVEPQHWETLAEYAALITVEQVFEVVSDNIAINLGLPPKVDDKTYSTRIQLLAKFNEVMVGRLTGQIEDTEFALANVRPLINQISLLDQSMTFAKQNASMQLYLELNPLVSAHDLEYALWYPLIAHIESCYAMLMKMENTPFFQMMRDGLIRRYYSVNRLVERIPMGLHDFVHTGAEAILVMPSLAYIVGLVYDVLIPISQLKKTIDDKTLEEAFYKSALLVRLQNDVGTNLLEMDQDSRHKLVLSLAQKVNPDEIAPNIYELIQHVAREDVVFTRMGKDIDFGEFNIALQQLNPNNPIETELHQLADSLDDIAKIYRFEYDSLKARLAKIAERTKSPQVAEFIIRIVLFHERLYRNTYRTQQGEYAI